MSVNKRNFDNFVMTLHTEQRGWTTGRCLHPGSVVLALRRGGRVGSILRQEGGFLRALAGKRKASSWAYDKGGHVGLVLRQGGGVSPVLRQRGGVSSIPAASRGMRCPGLAEIAPYP